MPPNTLKSFLRKAYSFCYGSPTLPPLGRKDFIKAGLLVLFIRGTISDVLFYIILRFQGVDAFKLDESDFDQIGLGTFLMIVVAVCTFYIPYYRVMHRRLVGVGFRFPRLFVCWAVAFSFVVSDLFPDLDGTQQWYWYVADHLVFVGLYAFLIPCLTWLPKEANRFRVHPDRTVGAFASTVLSGS